MPIGSVCTLSIDRLFLNDKCSLDPDFVVIYIVTVKRRQNLNDSLYRSYRSHYDDTHRAYLSTTS